MAVPTSLPVGLKAFRVSSKFGPRDIPGSTDHLGCDWATPVGIPLEAIITGTVSAVGGSLTHGWGYYVHIRDKDGDEVEYHILRDKPRFKYGERITKGQIIGHTGSSGSLRGKRYFPHHHLGAKLGGGWYYDPLTIGWPGSAGDSSTPFEEDDMFTDADRALLKLTANKASNAYEGVFNGAEVIVDGKVQKYTAGVLPIVVETQKRLAVQAGQIAALSAAVSNISGGTPINLTAIEEAAEKGAREAFDGITFKAQA